MDQVEGWAFWRFDLAIQLDSEQRAVDYLLQLPSAFASVFGGKDAMRCVCSTLPNVSGLKCPDHTALHCKAGQGGMLSWGRWQVSKGDILCVHAPPMDHGQLHMQMHTPLLLGLKLANSG